MQGERTGLGLAERDTRVGSHRKIRLRELKEIVDPAADGAGVGGAVCLGEHGESAGGTRMGGHGGINHVDTGLTR